MSYKKRVKKRNRKKVFTIILFIVIGYFILTSFITLFKRNTKTILAERMVITDSIFSQGFIIKDETLIKSKNNGVIDLTAEEGERIAAGREIATINTSEEMKTLEYELTELEKNILLLEEKESENVLPLTEDNDDGREGIIKELQKKVFSNDFTDITFIKEELLLYDENYDEQDFSERLIGQSIDSLKDRKENIIKELDQNHIKYYTNSPGVISYEIDGYEEVFLPKDFQDYTYEKLKVDKISTTVNNEESKVSRNDTICKVIDNFEWYMAIKIEKIDELQDFNLNDIIRINVGEDNEGIRGNIIAINNSKKKAVMVVRFNTMFQEYYKLRFPKVEIIKEEIDGYRLPKKSIVNLDNNDGVYIKDRSGIIRFRPVSIFKEDEDYVYIYSGDESRNIYLNKDEEAVKTINLFDEIIVNPNIVKEGDIL